MAVAKLGELLYPEGEWHLDAWAGGGPSRFAQHLIGPPRGGTVVKVCETGGARDFQRPTVRRFTITYIRYYYLRHVTCRHAHALRMHCSGRGSDSRYVHACSNSIATTKHHDHRSLLHISSTVEQRGGTRGSIRLVRASRGRAATVPLAPSAATRMLCVMMPSGAPTV